jgi:hypothetical protein
MTMASGVYGVFLKDALQNGKAFALNASDTIKLSLLADAHTPNFDTHDEFADLTNEVTGTNWAAAQTLGSPVCNLTVTTGFVTFDATDVSVATTTLTSVRGCASWDDTLAGDPLLHAGTFGQDYSTVAGTFAITWAATGIWRIDYA